MAQTVELLEELRRGVSVRASFARFDCGQGVATLYSGHEIKRVLDQEAWIIGVNVTVLIEIIPVDGVTHPDDREGPLEGFTLPRSQLVLKLRDRYFEAPFGAPVDLPTTRLGGLSVRWRRDERDD